MTTRNKVAVARSGVAQFSVRLWQYYHGGLMFYSIQFLRFIAAFGVVLHHSGAEVMHIDVFAAGVDIFFVISGFVISRATKIGETTWDFSLKRVIRVLPMYWMATIIFILMKYCFWNDMPPFYEIIKSALLIPSFDHHWLPIYFPAWTLVYEASFYIVFAVMIALVRPEMVRPLCIVMFFALSALSIPTPGGHEFFGTDMLAEFAFGLLLAEALPSIRRWSRNTAILIGGLSLTIFAWNYGGHAAPVRSISWGVPATMLVASAIALESWSLFRLPLIQRLGASSYAIYLLHLTVLIAIQEWLGRHGYAIKEHPFVSIPVFVMASIVVGVAVNAIVERPLLAALRRLTMARHAPAPEMSQA